MSTIINTLSDVEGHSGTGKRLYSVSDTHSIVHHAELSHTHLTHYWRWI